MVRTRRETSRRTGEEGFSERARLLLKMLVEQYLRDGVPVASKLLASSVHVSSATVRNIMSDLEAQGLVTAPHTSAGKIPTNQGLRFFVDSLISVQPLDARSVRRVRTELNPDRAPNQLVADASRLLSQVTRLAGVVTLPKPEQVALRQVEFLPLSGSRVLAILVVNERDVQNRVVHTDREYSEAELHGAANFINAHFAGRTLLEIRTDLLDEMRSDKERLNELMQTAIDVASKAFADDERESAGYVVSGESNLADSFAGAAALRELFDAFERKEAIVHLLDRCLGTDGIQLFIGDESGYGVFDDCTVVTARYEVDEQVAGVLGVIGPTRMAYDKIIPVVEVTARVLGAAMAGRTSDAAAQGPFSRSS